MRNGPLVVIGDTLLDVDIDGSAGRLAPDAPVPVVDCQTERHRAGGAGLAATLAAASGAEVVLVTALGRDAHAERLRALTAGRIQVIALPLHGTTPAKIRVRAAGQPLVRLDAGDGRLAPGPLPAAARCALEAAGAVLISDYGRGMAAHPALAPLLARAGREIPVVWDPHPRGPAVAAGTRLATPSQAEARTFAAALPGDRAVAGRPLGQAARDAAGLARAWGTAVAVTLGPGGALLSAGDSAPLLIPGAGRGGPAGDTCGAGDCFAAAAAVALRGGAVLPEAVETAVRSATGYVQSGGAAATPGRTYHAGAPRPRAQDAEHAPGAAGGPRGIGSSGAGEEDGWAAVSRARAAGCSIVAAGGCFDVLHAGHVQMLRQARGLGDFLVVCLNSDASVRALKGPGRPLVRAADRAGVLLGLGSVDAVVVFDEPEPSAVLGRLRPQVWVKGADYARGELAEAAVVRRHGGEVVLLPYTGVHSTSQIVAAARGGPA